MLVGGGQYAYPEGADRFFLTGAPIMGANPPKPAKRSPLRADVPCETQQAPDLRTQAAPPPSGFRVQHHLRRRQGRSSRRPRRRPWAG